MIFENTNRRTNARDSQIRPFNNQVPVRGKLPPQARDLEEAVLGALMVEKDALLVVIDFLKDDHFYVEAHQKIFRSIRSLFNSGSPVDILTVTQHLRLQGELEMVGGAFGVTELTKRVASAANIEYHARVVVQKYLQREIIRISSETTTVAYEDTTDILELVDHHQLQLYTLQNSLYTKESQDVHSIMSERALELHIPNEPGVLSGVGTGFRDIDAIYHGWQKTDLTIIAARPAMGKTAFVLNLARNAAVDFNKPVIIFSLEMSSKQLVDRLLSAEANVFLDRIMHKKLNEDEMVQIDKAAERFENVPIVIDDTPGLSVTEFRSKAIRAKKKYGVELIIVGYLQLMKGLGGNREQEIGSISRTLKIVAKELDVPVIALSQLSRAVESRAGNAKKPQLSDLRESGSIEQDADNVFFIYRPEYYQLTEVDGKPTKNLMQIIGAKNRNGVCETFDLGFNGAFMRCWDWNHKVNSNTYPQDKVQSAAAQGVLQIDYNAADDDAPF